MQGLLPHGLSTFTQIMLRQLGPRQELLPVEMYDQYDVDLYISAQLTTDDCVKNFAMASMDIENTLLTGSEADKNAILTIFGAQNLESILRPEDVMSMIGDIFAGSIQYGKRTAMCDHFSKDSFKNNSA